MDGVNPPTADRKSAAEQLAEQSLRVRKPAIVDLGGPRPVDVEIGGVGNAAFVLHEPVVHLLNEERVVAEIADTPFGIAHPLAVQTRKLAVPFQAEWRLDVEGVPALFDRAFMLEVVDVETDVVDDVVAGIARVRRHLLRPPSRTPVELEAG